MTTRSLVRPAALAALLALAAGTASAQTVLKIGYTPPKDSHYWVGATTFCDEIEKGTQARYKCQQAASAR
jgi:TRAP-type C4-dicarboxylate transport system substrate-binding protein